MDGGQAKRGSPRGPVVHGRTAMRAAAELTSHGSLPRLQNGLPTRLNKGVVELVSDFVVCKEGDKLTPQQAHLLRIFGQKQAVFQMKLLASWEAESGEVEVIDPGKTRAASCCGRAHSKQLSPPMLLQSTWRGSKRRPTDSAWRAWSCHPWSSGRTETARTRTSNRCLPM